MNVANYELSEELYKVSGWTTNRKWVPDLMNHGFFIEDGDPLAEGACPAYDLGYLLRKLPHLKDIDFRIEQDGEDENGYCWAAYGKDYAVHRKNDSWRWRSVASSPEDAMCQLIIALFKANILVKGEKHESTARNS